MNANDRFERGIDRVKAAPLFTGFISYSHVDRKAVRKIHRKLESYRIPKDLHRSSGEGEKGKRRLGQFYLDRHDFTMGNTLEQETLSALKRSAALILICSPDAAKSTAVDEEVRLFRSLFPERKIIPLILRGDPTDDENGCFPPSLINHFPKDHPILPGSRQILAADARKSGDGFELAFSKVIAALLDAEPDKVFRRQQRAQRQRMASALGLVSATAIALATSTINAEIAKRDAISSRQLVLKSSYQMVDELYTDYVGLSGVDSRSMRGILIRAVNMLESLKDVVPTTEFDHLRYASAVCELAVLHGMLGEISDGQRQLERCEQSLEASVTSLSSDRIRNASNSLSRYVTATISLNAPYSQSTIATVRSAIEAKSSELPNLEKYRVLSRLRFSLGRNHLSNGNFQTAISELRAAAEASDLFFKIDQFDTDHVYLRAQLNADLGIALLQLDQNLDALNSLEKSVQAYSQLLELRPFDDTERFGRMLALSYLAFASCKLGDSDQTNTSIRLVLSDFTSTREFILESRKRIESLLGITYNIMQVSPNCLLDPNLIPELTENAEMLINDFSQ